MSERARAQLRLERIGFVFQAYNLLPVLTAMENAEFPLMLRGVGREERRTEVSKLFEHIGLGGLEGRRPGALSGGQQQRVAVARALASRPAIIFGDEPTGNLDSATSSEILEFMREAVDNLGQTIVMVTHDPHTASYADHVLFLNDGQIVDRMDGPTPDRVFDRIKSLGG